MVAMTTNESIESRVVQRLKSAPLGDLITGEDLHDIVKAAIPKAFFEDRRVIAQGYHERDRIEKAPIVAMVHEALRESVKDAVSAWFIGNAEKVAEFWRPVLEKSIVEWVEELQRNTIRLHAAEVLRKTFEKANDDRKQRGLEPLFPFIP